MLNGWNNNVIQVICACIWSIHSACKVVPNCYCFVFLLFISFAWSVQILPGCVLCHVWHTFEEKNAKNSDYFDFLYYPSFKGEGYTVLPLFIHPFTKIYFSSYFFRNFLSYSFVIQPQLGISYRAYHILTAETYFLLSNLVGF